MSLSREELHMCRDALTEKVSARFYQIDELFIIQEKNKILALREKLLKMIDEDIKEKIHESVSEKA